MNRSLAWGRRVVCVASMVLAAGQARGDDFFWKLAQSGNVKVASNWVGNVLPSGATADMFVNVTDPATAYVVTMDSGRTFRNLTIDAPLASFKMTPGAQPSNTGAIRVVRGSLELGGPFFFAAPSTVEVGSGGALSVTGSTTIPAATPLWNSGTLTITNSTLQNTFAGGFTNSGSFTLGGSSGAWYYSTRTFTNNGTFTTNPLSAGTHTLSAALVNNGTANINGAVSVFSGNMENKGTMNVNASIFLGTRSFTQSSGTLSIGSLEAGSRGSIGVGTMYMVGGTVTTPMEFDAGTSGFTFVFNGGTLQAPVTINGGSAGAILKGGPGRTGTFVLHGPVTNQLGFDTGITIQNTSVDPFGARMFVQGNQTNFGTIVNGRAGSVAGSAFPVPTIDVTPGSSFNNGVGGVIGGGGIIDVTNNPGGTFENLGKIKLLAFFTNDTLSELSFKGSGLELGVPSQVESSFSFYVRRPESATLNADILLTCTGSIALDGLISLRIDTPYEFSVGESIVLVRAASITGAFDSFTVIGGPTGLEFVLDYSSTSVAARVTAVPGASGLACLGVAGLLAGRRRR